MKSFMWLKWSIFHTVEFSLNDQLTKDGISANYFLHFILFVKMIIKFCEKNYLIPQFIIMY